MRIPAFALALLIPATAAAQYHQTDFPAEEFRARHAKAFEQIGPNVPEENLYLRYEDTIVVTETGYENFTDFLPMELDDMERLVLEKGVVQRVPPTPAGAVTSRQRNSPKLWQ